MAFAYVLINTEASKEHEVYDKLKNYSHITDLVPLLSGEFDLVARVEDESPNEIIDYIENYIRTMPGITYTKSLLGRKFSWEKS